MQTVMGGEPSRMRHGSDSERSGDEKAKLRSRSLKMSLQLEGGKE